MDEYSRAALFSLIGAAVVEWYESGMISQDKAAEIAGLSRYDFIRLLGRYQVSAIQYTPDVVAEEMRHAQRSKISSLSRRWLCQKKVALVVPLWNASTALGASSRMRN